jgi:adenylate cyclase class IV
LYANNNKLATEGVLCYPLFHMFHPIELELRAEIHATDVQDLEKRLRTLGFKRSSITRRTSIMHFGHVTRFDQHTCTDKDHVDIRCRITNGKAEVVSKIGALHIHNRTEIGTPVSLKDMVAFGRMFAAMGFYSKAGSRLNINFKKGGICITFTQSPSGLAYIEIEKMSTPEQEKIDLREIQSIAKTLRVDPWKTQQQYYDFCDRFKIEDDWDFHGTDEEIKRLKAEIKRIGSSRR